MSTYTQISREQEKPGPANQSPQGLISVTSQSNVANTLSTNHLLQLQRTIGNQAVMRMLASSPVQRTPAQSDSSDVDHSHGCKCAACATMIADRPRTASTVQRVLVPHVIQREKCNCRQSGGKHASSCPRNKNRLKAKNEQQQTENKENRSWSNMQKYRSKWVINNGITEQLVKRFCKDYGPIPGHASQPGVTDVGEQAVTTDALTAYRNWHTRQFGWVG